MVAEDIPRCLLCGATPSRPFSRQRLATWWRCAPCGLFFVHPQPDPETLSRLYALRYYAERYDRAPEAIAERDLYWARRVRRLAEVAEPGRVLDVGCGQGDFLASALARGWSAFGCEVEHPALAGLPDRLRRRTVVAGLESPPFPVASFRAVTLFDVIEHVREPVRFLEQARALLEPGGEVMVTTPNAGVLKARLRGRFWKYFRFERYLHLYHFTPESLTAALGAAGFTVSRWFSTRMPMVVTARSG